MNSLLSFERVAVARGDRVLLRNLSGAVAPGDILHLRGSNGIGKTSLLEVLCGLREPAEGMVTLSAEPEECHWVGHRNGLNHDLTPAENLRFWCTLQNADAAGVGAALHGFGLNGIGSRSSRQLSAGQKRRVALARLALAPRKLWFLDEPLASLDQEGIGQLSALLGKHQARGGAAVITSHQSLPVAMPGLRTLELG